MAAREMSKKGKEVEEVQTEFESQSRFEFESESEYKTESDSE